MDRDERKLPERAKEKAIKGTGTEKEGKGADNRVGTTQPSFLS